MTLGDQSYTLQHHTRDGHNLKLLFKGSAFDVTVRTADEHEMAKLMPPKVVVDVGRNVLSPMPGVIISVAVQPGSHVASGAEVAIIEAMKMQNKLVAPREGKVKQVHCKVSTFPLTRIKRNPK